MKNSQIKDAILAGEVIEKNAWTISVDDNDDVLIFPPKGDGFKTSLGNIDTAVKDFCKKAEMPIPGVKTSHPPKNVSDPNLGEDSSTKEPFKTPSVNKYDKPDGKKSPTSLGEDTSTNEPFKTPSVNKRPKTNIEEGGLPDTDLGSDTSSDEPNWGDKVVTIQSDGRVSGGRRSAQESQSMLEPPEDRALIEHLSEWAYSGEPSYVVSSNWIAGRPVPYDAVEAALDELTKVLWGERDAESKGVKTQADDLEELIAKLEEYVNYDAVRDETGSLHTAEFIDTFAPENRPAPDFYKEHRAPSLHLLEDIMDPDAWAAKVAYGDYHGSDYENDMSNPHRQPSTETPALVGYDDETYEDFSDDVEAGCHGKPKKKSRTRQAEGFNPPSKSETKAEVSDPNVSDMAEDSDRKADLDEATDYFYRDKKEAGPKLREKWDDAGGYNRDMEAESAEELYHLVRSFGTEDDYDWSSYKPSMPMAPNGIEEGSYATDGKFEGPEVMGTEASTKEAVDEDAKKYFEDYYGDYGKDLVKDDSSSKDPRDKKPKKNKEDKKESRKAARQRIKASIARRERKKAQQHGSEFENRVDLADKVLMGEYTQMMLSRGYDAGNYAAAYGGGDWQTHIDNDPYNQDNSDYVNAFILAFVPGVSDNWMWDDNYLEAWNEVGKQLKSLGVAVDDPYEAQAEDEGFSSMGSRRRAQQFQDPNLQPAGQNALEGAPVADAGPPATGQAPATPQAPAPSKPKDQGLPPGSGDSGLTALGWTPEEVKLMDDKDKQIILQNKLHKPGTKPQQGAEKAPKAPPTGNEQPPTTPTPSMPGAAPVPSPVAARMMARRMQQKLQIRKAQQALAEPAAPAPVPAAPPAQAPAVEPTAAPAPSDMGDGGTDAQALQILQDVRQQPVQAMDSTGVAIQKSKMLVDRLLSELGMTADEAKDMFGVKNLAKLFQ
jgi:hypothetical protein